MPMRRISAADVAPAHLDAIARELIAQHASTHEGVVQMQPIDAAHQLQVGRADRAGQVVHRASAHAQQLGLACDGEVVVTLDSIALRSAIPPW